MLSDLDDGRWGLTEIGQAILERPTLPKSVADRLDGLNPAQRLTLTRELGEQGASAMPEIRNAIRRQWQRSLGR